MSKKQIVAAFIAASLLSAVQAKTFVYCTEASPEGFDAARHVTVPTFNASSETIYNKLVTFERDSVRVVPDLAERWEVSADGLSYTFYLRRGVQWHTTAEFKPTRSFEADDVVFSIERFRNPDFPYNKAAGNVTYPYNKAYASNIRSVEKVDSHTVRISLTKRDAALLANLAMPTSIIVSAEYASKLMKQDRANDLDLKPIGTGPFILQRYEKDSQIRYDSNLAYWNGKPAFEKLVFVVVRDSAVRLQKLKAGECQLSSSPRPQELASIRSDRNLILQEIPGLNIGYIGFNTQKAPFNLREVRRALAMAIDKPAILDALFQGSAVAASGLLPPNVLGYERDVKDLPYDPAGARKLLAQAGFPNGFETELLAMPIARSYMPDARKMAEMVQADLAKIGVRVRIVSYEWGEYIKRIAAGEHQMAILGWTTDTGDPDNFYTPVLSCARPNAPTRWCNTDFENLIERARQSSENAERSRFYREAAAVVRREIPLVPIAHAYLYQPVRREVQGFKISPLTRTVIYGTTLN